MDPLTLADWIGHDHTDYDLDAAVELLDGITDLDAHREQVMEVLARCELTEPDPVAEMGLALLGLARDGGGTWGDPIQITVDGDTHEGSTTTSIRTTLDGTVRFVWVSPDGTGPDVTALHEAWEDATTVWEGEERDLSADLLRAHRAVQEAKAVYDKAVAARRAQVRRWTGSGRSMYRAAQLMEVSQSMVQRMAK